MIALQPNELVEFREDGELVIGHVKEVDRTAVTVQMTDGRKLVRALWRVRRPDLPPAA